MRDAPAGRGGASGGLGEWLDQRRRARPALLTPARPTVSFTFDLFPRSAARTGAALLENVGARGTFYASGALAGQVTPHGVLFDATDIDRLQAAGHEIGCATYGALNCARAGADDVLADMVRNAEALAALGLDSRLVSFAYPEGRTSTALKTQLPGRFTSARGLARGLASGKADLAHLRANALYGPAALTRSLALIEAARRKRGWVIFAAYDVGPRPGPVGTPSGLLERLCGAAFAAGMRIAPVRDALRLILVESAA
ncbi:MAG: polysaccharide deacetylase family protein [Hyphomonadaceae bacterium]|nr:polysaccharide deacetylase family protein [Hyphomonadaceae bacterium]